MQTGRKVTVLAGAVMALALVGASGCTRWSVASADSTNPSQVGSAGTGTGTGTGAGTGTGTGTGIATQEKLEQAEIAALEAQQAAADAQCSADEAQAKADTASANAKAARKLSQHK